MWPVPPVCCRFPGRVPLATGTYSSTNKDGTHVFLRVLSIVLPSVEQSAVTLENAAQGPYDTVAAAGPSSFVFRGFFHFIGVGRGRDTLTSTICGPLADWDRQ